MKFRYLKRDKSRHGKDRLYVRLPGRPMIRLPVDREDDPRFIQLYAAAINGDELAQPKPKTTAKIDKAAPGSLRELCAKHFEYLAKDTVLAIKTKTRRRQILEELCREMVSAKDQRTIADWPVKQMTTALIQKLIDRKAATPEAANDRRKSLQALFKWAIPRGYGDANPVDKTERMKSKTGGHVPWEAEHVRRYLDTHPPGSKAYLALMLLLCTGQRRGDVLRFGRQHVKDGYLVWKQQKGSKSMKIRILDQLQWAIDQLPHDQMLFLTDKWGKQYSDSAFSHWFQDRCREAGLQGLSAHGLRKTFLTIGAQSGASAHMLMASAGHSSIQMTSLYTAQVERDGLSEQTMSKLAGAQLMNEIGAPKLPPLEKCAKSSEKAKENKG
jgi:integrase